MKINGKTKFDYKGKSFADLVKQIVAYGKKNPSVWEGDYDSFEEWKQDMEDEMLTDCPVDVVFTKSGTYMVKYSDSSLAVATWHWVNESQGILGYWWGFDDEDQEQQKVDVSFKGQHLNIVESDIEHDEDGIFEEGFEFVMVAAK